MTAPLVVGRWICSQYYFSANDPDEFGAGDKLLHNPIGALGVLTGPTGDLRVGLPLQSTHVSGRRHHQPLRMLAVIYAWPEVIEKILRRNPVVARLVEGSWIRLTLWDEAGQRWLTRTAEGNWEIANPVEDS